MKKKIFNVLILLSLILSACSSATVSASVENTAIPEVTEPVVVLSDESGEESDEDILRPSNWSEETHSNDVEPNYDVVFPDDEVKQITITITPEEWAVMQANMAELYGDATQGVQVGGMPGEDEIPQDGRPAPAEGDVPQDGRPAPGEGEVPQGGRTRPGEGDVPEMTEGALNERPGGGMDMGVAANENPTWVEATIEFEGNIWTNVGVRYKGNSSLSSGWRSGSAKLPFKLDFDEFEDEYPEIDDQRFYGFKQLSLANGYLDESLMRDAVSAQIYEEAGLPVAETAFYEIILDYGEGPVSLGLYTMIEVIDDTAIERYFGEDDGNIYDADGSAASFAANTYDQIETSFDKENNSDSDWNDIEALFEILHDDLRTEDPASWRAELEAHFDVEGFLEWLAISAVIDHWDSYGNMTHNYYLYNNPETEQITWITWDHNETLSPRSDFGNRGISLDKADINESWPLIRYLLDDPVYYELYINYLAETIAGPFDPDLMAETYQTLADLIAPYAANDVGAAAFNTAVQELIDYSYQRTNEVEIFLAELEN